MPGIILFLEEGIANCMANCREERKMKCMNGIIA